MANAVLFVDMLTGYERLDDCNPIIDKSFARRIGKITGLRGEEHVFAQEIMEGVV